MERNNAMRCLHNEDSDKKAFSGGTSLSKLCVCARERARDEEKKSQKVSVSLSTPVNLICMRL